MTMAGMSVFVQSTDYVILHQNQKAGNLNENFL